jgi:hypothetical protein
VQLQSQQRVDQVVSTILPPAIEINAFIRALESARLGVEEGHNAYAALILANVSVRAVALADALTPEDMTPTIGPNK